MPRISRFSPADRFDFDTKTELWLSAGLGPEVEADPAETRRARRTAVLLAIAIAGVVTVFAYRQSLFAEWAKPVRFATAALLTGLGWSLARNLTRGIAPALFRRLDPAAAGTIGFLVRLTTVLIAAFVALRFAGVKPGTLALGGAFTAVVLGLAAQQTLGNLIAGIVLLRARTLRVGDRVELQGGFLAGKLEGVVGALGLFYTTIVVGGDRARVPNNVLMNVAIRPIREPDRIEMRARIDASISPAELQRKLEAELEVPLRRQPEIGLEEIDGEQIVVSITAVPRTGSDGAALAEQIIAAIREERVAA